MLITIPYTEIVGYAHDRPIEAIIASNFVKISAGIVEDSYDPHSKIKSKSHYEIRVILENGSVYILSKCRSKKDMLNKFKKLCEKISKGAKISIVSSVEAILV